MARAAHESLVALTGATGFVGRRLTRALTRKGYRVRALTRRQQAPTSELLEWVSGSLEDPESLSRLVEGAEAVVHCAGVVRGASEETFAEVNALGTARLVQVAAAQSEPARFLLISSIAAREPQLSWYASSKRQGERLLEERSGRMVWTVFRPTALYGPGDREMLPLFKAMKRGVLPVVGADGGRITLLHVDDLARAVVQWVDQPLEEGHVLELHDGTEGGYGWQQIAAIAQAAWDRPIRVVQVPSGVLDLVAWLNLGLSRVTRGDPMLTPGKVRELRHPSWVCDNTSVTKVLAWTPQIDLATALRTGAVFA
ncbi:MAG: NAD-dependent epimerase/dehydratase family protein [Longimicrobiales bacterium]